MSNFGRRSLAVVAMLLIAVLAFYVGTAVVSTAAQQSSGNVTWPVTTPQPANTGNAVLDNEKLYSSLYSQVSPSVVSINVIAQQSVGNNLNGQQTVEGTGSGFVIDTQGDIVTNNHVVQGATSIEVNFFDGSIYRGTVVGTDADSDLAVVKVNRPANELHPVTLGDSDQLFVGQDVIAIGSPFNQPWTMTTGVVSALNRTIDSLGQFRIGAVIQTDAAINPGNSGGPLVDLKGEVVGVNAQIETNTGTGSGVGFAIPSNLVKRVSQALIQNGKVDYSYLGIQGTDVNLYFIEALKLPNDARGVVVSAVEPNGPAAQAGLKDAGNPQSIDGVNVPTSADIITEVNGTPVTSMDMLIAYLANKTKPGDTITLTVVRDGTQQLSLPVTLTPRPAGT